MAPLTERYTLHTVPPAQGLAWVRQGLRLFVRKPLGLTLLFMTGLLATLLLMSLPFVGALLGMALLPLLTLAFMLASRALLALPAGGAPPRLVLAPLDKPRAKALGLLCGIYGVLAWGVMLLFNATAGEALWALQQAMNASPGSASPALAEALADPRLSQGLLVLGLLGSVLSVPFWHAPALVWWGGQGVAQALFSSSLAVWRAKGAFSLYTLAWLGAYLGATLVMALLLSLLGMPGLAPVASLPLALAFSTAFYTSLWFSYADSFGVSPPLSPPA